MSEAPQHPEELLAEYVDGTLGPEDRTRVEAHVAACATCREEVELAGSARRALTALPELDVPAGTTWQVIQRARQRRRWLPQVSPRTAWVAAGTAAAAAAVIGVFALVGGPRQEAAGPEAAFGRNGEAEAPPGAAPGEPSESGRLLSGLYPIFRQSDRDYDSDSLPDLAVDLTDQARGALEQGFPEPPSRYYATTSLAQVSPRTRRALNCVVKAVSPGRSLAPFAVVTTTFEGEPAYVGAFLQADQPDRSYEQLVLYVVAPDGCALRSFARQQL